jgi:hypothetical protein
MKLNFFAPSITMLQGTASDNANIRETKEAPDPTGFISITYTADGDARRSWFNIETGAAIHDMRAYGSVVAGDGNRHVHGEERLYPSVKYEMCPDACYVEMQGRMWMVGGDRAQLPVDHHRCGTISVLNTDTWEWDVRARPPFGGVIACAAAMDNRIYMATEDSRRVHVWDAITDGWSTITAGRHPITKMFRVGDAIVTAGTREIGIIDAADWTPMASFNFGDATGFVWHYFSGMVAPM